MAIKYLHLVVKILRIKEAMSLFNNFAADGIQISLNKFSNYNETD
jgi:hypothetical protein